MLSVGVHDNTLQQVFTNKERQEKSGNLNMSESQGILIKSGNFINVPAIFYKCFRYFAQAVPLDALRL